MIERIRQLSANSTSSARKCSTTVVPRSALVIGSTEKSASPLDSQCTPCSAGAPARRVNTSDALGDDKRRIKADAELADQLRIFLLIAAEITQELGGTGARDGAEMADHILARHADAVVADGDGVRVFASNSTTHF